MKNFIYTNNSESSKLKRFFSFIFLKEISKTKNELQLVRVRSVFIKTLAILVTTSLINSKVNAMLLPKPTDEIAKTFLSTPDSYEKVRLNLTDLIKGDLELFVSLNNVEHEASLEIETWMLDHSTFTPPFESIEVEIEPALELEDWMIQHNYFNVLTVETENEPKLELETWMLDHHNWK